MRNIHCNAGTSFSHWKQLGFNLLGSCKKNGIWNISLYVLSVVIPSHIVSFICFIVQSHPLLPISMPGPLYCCSRFLDYCCYMALAVGVLRQAGLAWPLSELCVRKCALVPVPVRVCVPGESVCDASTSLIQLASPKQVATRVDLHKTYTMFVHYV